MSEGSTVVSDETLDQGMPRLIQAGMGIRVSSYHLAHETARLGALGVVSSVALRHVVVEEVRRGEDSALSAAASFPISRYRDELLAFAPGGAFHNRAVPLDAPGEGERACFPRRLSAIAAYVEVLRAKQGHTGKVGLNVMWKCVLTVLPSIYGAMLAGVDALLCGAGVPMELPDIVRRLRAGEDLNYDPLHGTGTPVRLEVAQDEASALLSALPAPHLLPILSNFAFPKRILDVWGREYEGARPFAFILENHEAGGHNAPPRDKSGAYGTQDDIESYFDKVRDLGVPVYVAGAFAHGGTREDYDYWRRRGAYGIQIGSRFALCDESGLRRNLKDNLLQHHRQGDASLLTDARISPTGYPFKVVPLPGTIADPKVAAQRRRVCDKGYLLHSHRESLPDGTIRETYLCPAMPARQYERLGGDPADTEGRICLCNGLLAAVGFSGRNGNPEPPLLTLGRSGSVATGRASARQVIEEILSPSQVAVAEKTLARIA